MNIQAPNWGYFGRIGEVSGEDWADDVIQLIGDCGFNTMYEAKEAWSNENRKATVGQISLQTEYLLAKTAIEYEEEDTPLDQYGRNKDGEIGFMASQAEHDFVKWYESNIMENN